MISLYYFFLNQHNKITKKVCNSFILLMGVRIDGNILVIVETKLFHFHFDLSIYVLNRLKHEIELIAKNNILYEYKHGNNIYENRKQ